MSLIAGKFLTSEGPNSTRRQRSIVTALTTSLMIRCSTLFYSTVIPLTPTPGSGRSAEGNKAQRVDAMHLGDDSAPVDLPSRCALPRKQASSRPLRSNPICLGLIGEFVSDRWFEWR